MTSDRLIIDDARDYLPLFQIDRVFGPYGRKGHLKAIWMQRRDGSNPVQSAMRSGTRYSYLEQLEHGNCWHLKRLDRRDENGVMVNTRPVFLQVLTECMAR